MIWRPDYIVLDTCTDSRASVFLNLAQDHHKPPISAPEVAISKQLARRRSRTKHQEKMGPDERNRTFPCIHILDTRYQSSASMYRPLRCGHHSLARPWIQPWTAWLCRCICIGSSGTARFFQQYLLGQACETQGSVAYAWTLFSHVPSCWLLLKDFGKGSVLSWGIDCHRWSTVYRWLKSEDSKERVVSRKDLRRWGVTGHRQVDQEPHDCGDCVRFSTIIVYESASFLQ